MPTLVYEGKNKNVYRLPSGALQIQFKDAITGVNGVFDPAAKSILKTVPGAALSSLHLSAYFFKKLNAIDVPTHFISINDDSVSMTVKDTKPFGPHGIDVICRFRAIGTFEERYSEFVEHGEELDSFVELILKDENEELPPITPNDLAELNILTPREFDFIKQLSCDVAEFIRMDLAKKGLELYDIKLEFGRDSQKNDILLINEISANNMHVYQGERLINPIELEAILLG
jgi:phosphoribosylaminoimidazole-succinocarboxamide synthase